MHHTCRPPLCLTTNPCSNSTAGVGNVHLARCCRCQGKLVHCHHKHTNSTAATTTTIVHTQTQQQQGTTMTGTSLRAADDGHLSDKLAELRVDDGLNDKRGKGCAMH